MQPTKLLGEILVKHSVISEKTRDRVLGRSKILGRRFGSILEDLELITGDELANALAEQYNCKTISNIAQLPVDAELLSLIPIEGAIEHMIFPLKRTGDSLALALTDPTKHQLLANIAINVHLKIVPFVTTKDEIREAICHHYLGKEVTKRSVERTVLVIDPDRDFSLMLMNILKKEGYRIITAKDGMEGFRYVISESPHLVITDINAPKLNGFALHGALKKISETNFIPVIIISDQTQGAKEEQKAFELGIFDMIMKPFTDGTIRARVKRAFHFYDHQYRLY